MSANLKVAKECGAYVWDASYSHIEQAHDEGDVEFSKEQFEAYTSRILASQQAAHDAEIAKLKEEMVKCEQRVAAKVLEDLLPVREMWTAASGKYWYMHIKQKILELRTAQEAENE